MGWFTRQTSVSMWRSAQQKRLGTALSMSVPHGQCARTSAPLKVPAERHGRLNLDRCKFEHPGHEIEEQTTCREESPISPFVVVGFQRSVGARGS